MPRPRAATTFALVANQVTNKKIAVEQGESLFLTSTLTLTAVRLKDKAGKVMFDFQSRSFANVIEIVVSDDVKSIDFLATSATNVTAWTSKDLPSCAK